MALGSCFLKPASFSAIARNLAQAPGLRQCGKQNGLFSKSPATVRMWKQKFAAVRFSVKRSEASE